jgi:hypothetical protein
MKRIAPNFILNKRPIIANTILVSAFPGTGKSFYHSHRYVDALPFKMSSDSDSSKFDKKEFPENYIQHIKEEIIKETPIVFVSSHKAVRDALVFYNLPFVLVYPSKDLKEEYLERYKKRGSNDNFIQLISNNWGNWIDECRLQDYCFHIELKKGQFIADVI